jgi:CO/xanthine dehydrogenase Mo-binding subunit
MSRIRFLQPDTNRVADSGPTVASRGTIMGGGAAKIAAENIYKIMLKTAVEEFGIPSEQIQFQDEKILAKEKKGFKEICTFDELVSRCYAKGRPLFASGVRHIGETFWDDETGQGDAYFTFVYGANTAEVEVDNETGKVDVISFISAHDVGRAINRAAVEAQIYGGVGMGMGYGIMEEFIQENGIPKTVNFDEYIIPTTMDMPQMQAVIIENPDEKGPFGAKSIGEPALEIAAPAIINAIYNATGKRVYNLPANLEEVLLGRKLRRDAPRASVSCKIDSGQENNEGGKQ